MPKCQYCQEIVAFSDWDETWKACTGCRDRIQSDPFDDEDADEIESTEEPW